MSRKELTDERYKKLTGRSLELCPGAALRAVCKGTVGGSGISVGRGLGSDCAEVKNVHLNVLRILLVYVCQRRIVAVKDCGKQAIKKRLHVEILVEQSSDIKSNCS